jgi:predicted DNA-binding transcriptional regulator AlpA
MKDQMTLPADETFGVPALLRKQTVLAVTGLSEKSLALRLAAGTFPKPVLLTVDAAEVEEVEERLAYCAPAVRWMRTSDLLGPDFPGGYLAFVHEPTERAKWFALEFPDPAKSIPRLAARAA